MVRKKMDDTHGFFDEVYDHSFFAEQMELVKEQLSNHLDQTIHQSHSNPIRWNAPEKELAFWQHFLKNGNPADLIPEVLKRTTHTHHPKYVGHQVAATAPITAITAMVSALLNNGMAIYEMGMSPSAIERVVIDALCQQVGYDAQSGGFLTSGGSLANLTALLAARKTIVAHDVWQEGHGSPLGVMVCEEAHYCVDRAAKIMGLGDKGIIKIPSLSTFSMDVSLLETYYEKAKASGIEVFAIIGSAPSTATGAYDNLVAIGKFAQEKQIWFHVDGAHGGAAIFSEKYKSLLNGIAQADSIVIDGHKMMMMPTITTALLFKNKWQAQQTFNQKADYLLDDAQDDQWYQSGKMTFECTKTMMCLHWFVLLKLYGKTLFDAFVTRQYDLAKAFEKLLQQDPEFELACAPQSNILCFRWIDNGLAPEQLNAINAGIRQVLLEDGEYYLVQTRLKGIHYMRTTLMNPFTTIAHLQELLNSIKAVARKINL